MNTNDKTGLPGLSREQIELQIRKENPYLDDVIIKEIIDRIVSDNRRKEQIKQIYDV